MLSLSEQEILVQKLKSDPILHIKEMQGVDSLEEYQERICKAIAEHERVVVSACHSIGKTFTLAKIVLWFMSTFEQSKVITTAPTFNQVKNLLWAEIRSGWKNSRSSLGGEMLTTGWKIDDDWFAIGFTSKFEANAGESQGTASSFQGFHGKHILVVFDEATGIPHQIWTQAEGLLTSGAVVRFVAIANPTSRACEFFKCFKSGSYHKIHLSCFDSPNLKANGIKDMKSLEKELVRLKALTDAKKEEELKAYKLVNPNLLSTSWVMRAALKWGVTHPLFISKVLGQFPEEDDNVLIKLGIVETAQRRENKKSKDVLHRSVGVDPARFGSNFTVITIIEDGSQTFHKPMSKRDTHEISGEIINILRGLPRAKEEIVCVDGTGVGAGVIDALNEAKRTRSLDSRVSIREVHFGAASTDREHYFNLKAQMYDELKLDLISDLSILPMDIYQEQLPTILYKFTSKGQLIIESKEEYTKRTGLPSPDDADSLALANYGRKHLASGKWVDSENDSRQHNDITGDYY